MKEKTIGTKDDPLEWWKTKKHQYPLMSHLALKYLCIQAASTAAERAFSLLGNILTKKRTSLSDEQVNMLSYLLIVFKSICLINVIPDQSLISLFFFFNK